MDNIVEISTGKFLVSFKTGIIKVLEMDHVSVIKKKVKKGIKEKKTS